MKGTILFVMFLIFVMSFPYVRQKYFIHDVEQEIIPMDEKISDSVVEVKNNIKKKIQKVSSNMTSQQKIMHQYHDFFFDNEALPFLGNPDGKIKIVHVIDYVCPYCTKNLPVMKELIKRNENVKVIILHTPKLGELSKQLAMISLHFYSMYPERFAEFHDRVSAFRNDNNFSFDKIFDDMALDFEDFKSKIDFSNLNTIIDHSMVAAREVGMTSVPSYIIKDKFYGGTMNLDQLEREIKKHYSEN